MQRETPSPQLPIGAQMPAFSLPSTAGDTFNSTSFSGAKASLVAFTCNHCPYVKGSEQMLLATITAFAPKGLRAVMISSNDAAQYPEDGFEKMKEKAVVSKLPCPYLYDESQQVAGAFDAACTPELYLFDGTGKLAYHGTINDSPKDATKATRNFLEIAIGQLLSGVAPSPNYVHPLGCSIKWKLGS